MPYNDDDSTYRNYDDEPRNSRGLMDSINTAIEVFASYQAECRRIDVVYSDRSMLSPLMSRSHITDHSYDVFWASMEILKPAIFSKPPIPVVTTRFKDRDPVQTKTAELLERCVITAIGQEQIEQVMTGVRDDLAFTNRGAMWIRYESGDGKGQRVCLEHIDRTDFLHEPARKWSEVGWVARRAWLTKKEIRERFGKTIANEISFEDRNDDRRDGQVSNIVKASVWEVWHKADNKVYWVTEGYDKFLDESEPYLDIEGFFPCPRPAYGTLRRRTLIPIPDYVRYEQHLAQINTLTSRIYSLLDQVVLRGFYAGGGDVEKAVETLLNMHDSAASKLISVPMSAFNGTNGSVVQWLPLDQITAAITGLIAAREQLFNDFYQLSGISDIMRGATEAGETLGAQQLKSQYGSVRVRDKIDELARMSREAIQIMASIMAEKFSQKSLLEMSQMNIRTESEIKKQIKDDQAKAKKEMEQLAKHFEDEIKSSQQAGEPVDSEALQEQFTSAQEEVVMRYQRILSVAEREVPIEAVVKLLRDEKLMGFVLDIETDSTIMTDELAEKASRSEFLNAFNSASAGLAQLASTSEAGAALAGGMLKFAIAPFRVGRELDGLIDDFVDTSTQLASAQAEDPTSQIESQIAEAQQKLAEAELQKAQAQMAKVEADSMIKQAELQSKMQQMDINTQEKQAQMQLESQKLEQRTAELQMNYEKLMAEIDNIKADTMKKMTDAGIAVSDQQLREFESLKNIAIQSNGVNQASLDTSLSAIDI